MSESAPRIRRSPRNAPAWCATAAAALCLMACMDAGSASAPRDEAPAPAQALQEGPQRPDGVPPGCTREWDRAVADSVLNCPDIRPPAPR